jgi:hypothetical protein
VPVFTDGTVCTAFMTGSIGTVGTVWFNAEFDTSLLVQTLETCPDSPQILQV